MRFAVVNIDYTNPNVSIIAIEIVDNGETLLIQSEPTGVLDLPEDLEQEVRTLINKLQEHLRSKSDHE